MRTLNEVLLGQNLDKTMVVPLGENFRTDKDARICENRNLVWTDTFTLLGVTFDSRMEKMSSNYDEKYNKVEDLIEKWKKRMLTLSGRLMIAKCYFHNILTYFKL